MTRRRITTFLASVLVALCSGTNYVYSAYGPQLGGRLQLSHATQNLVGLSGNFGVAASGPFLGRLVDSRGPQLSLGLSFVLLLIGYLGIKIVYDASEDAGGPAGGGTLFVLILFELFTGIGSEAGYCGALNSVMKSFPDKIRTTTTGIVVAGFGLSAFLFSTIARSIFPGNTSNFLLTLGLGTPIPMALGWFLIRPSTYPEPALRTTLEVDDEELDDETAQLIMEGDTVSSPSITGLPLLQTADFWILFWIVSLLAGSGIMWINNIGLMARALALNDSTTPNEQETVKWQTLQVSTMSIASCLGRIIIGVIADFVKHRGMRRAQCISLVAVSFIISQLAGLRVHDVEDLQYAVFFVGISYGAMYGILPIIMIEWFGIAHVSENCGYIVLSVLVMGNVFSLMFGRIFDAHSSYDEYGMRCLEGAQCYLTSLYVTTLACVFALFLAIVAARRDRKYV